MNKIYLDNNSTTLIDPEVLKEEDNEMLEDLILTAINQATKNVESVSQEKMGSLTGGMKIPGLF